MFTQPTCAVNLKIVFLLTFCFRVSKLILINNKIRKSTVLLKMRSNNIGSNVYLNNASINKDTIYFAKMFCFVAIVDEGLALLLSQK